MMLAILKDCIPPNRNQIVFLLVIIILHIISILVYIKMTKKHD